MPDFRTFLNNKKYRNFLVLAVIALAIPLTVILALKQQEIRGRAAAAPDQLEAEGGVLGGNATIVTDTTASGGKSVRFSASVPTQSPTPTPTPTTTSRKVVNVSSIAALKTNLADNTVDEIVVTNGTYTVSTANSQKANSLFIGSAYAGRTRPILVRAQTTGGVTFDGGGTTYFGGITFDEGVHHQTWDGFRFANGEATSTGVIDIGNRNIDSAAAGAHHITLRNITLTNTLHGYAYDPTKSNANDHGIYISEAIGGVHDILFDGLTFVAAPTNPLHSVLHLYNHGYDNGTTGSYNITFRNANITGSRQAIILWDRFSSNILIEDTTITGATNFAVRYEKGSPVTLRRVTSTGSGVQGFYSSLGPNPPGVTFIDTNLK